MNRGYAGLIVGLALGLITLLLVLWWVSDAPDDPPAAPPAQTAEAPTPRSRVSIPRPAPRPAESEPPVAAQPTAPAEPDTDASDPHDPDDDDTDAFPWLEGGAPALNRQLRPILREVAPELVACLSDWGALQPDVFQGTAVFVFEVDQQGLQTIDIVDVDSVPEPTLACLGDVLWDELDGPTHPVSTEVEWPVQLSVRPD